MAAEVWLGNGSLISLIGVGEGSREGVLGCSRMNWKIEGAKSSSE